MFIQVVHGPTSGTGEGSPAKPDEDAAARVVDYRHLAAPWFA